MLTLEDTRARVLSSFVQEFGYMTGDQHDIEIDYDSDIAFVTISLKGFTRTYVHYWARLNKNGSVKKNSWRLDYND